MQLYRITYYDGWSVWAAQLAREYIYFTSEEEAIHHAQERVKNSQLGYQVMPVAQFGE